MVVKVDPGPPRDVIVANIEGSAASLNLLRVPTNGNDLFDSGIATRIKHCPETSQLYC